MPSSKSLHATHCAIGLGRGPAGDQLVFQVEERGREKGRGMPAASLLSISLGSSNRHRPHIQGSPQPGPCPPERTLDSLMSSVFSSPLPTMSPQIPHPTPHPEASPVFRPSLWCPETWVLLAVGTGQG